MRLRPETMDRKPTIGVTFTRVRVDWAVETLKFWTLGYYECSLSRRHSFW